MEFIPIKEEPIITYNTPPSIYNDTIELFDHKGKKSFKIYSIKFYNCNENIEDCVHTIQITYINDTFSLFKFEYLIIHNVHCNDIIRYGYGKYIKENVISLFNKSNCNLKNYKLFLS
jgi:hypothetical protein